MRPITINSNNEPYYSEVFIKGFKCGAERQFEADKASITTKQVKYYDEDENVWKIGEVIVNSSEKPNNLSEIQAGSTTEDCSDVGKEKK